MAAAFVLLFFAYRSVGLTSRFERDGFYWYPLFLTVPLAAALATRPGRDDVADALATTGGGWAPLFVLGGIALGVLLFVVDAASARLPVYGRGRFVEGRVRTLSDFHPSPVV